MYNPYYQHVMQQYAYAQMNAYGQQQQQQQYAAQVR